MLLNETVKIKWNSKNKKHFVDLGYEFTKMKDEVEVKVNDLKYGSLVRVDVLCDYCYQIYHPKWREYCSSHKNCDKDSCGNPICTGKKAHEALYNIYGTHNIFDIPEIAEKRNNTNIEKYGCINPFGNKEIIDKIKQYYLNTFGVEYGMQVPEIVKKGQQTCMDKYGVANYGKIYSETHIKEMSPTWKGGVDYHRNERCTYEYNQWRKKVFERDHFTCQKCGAHNYKGNGKTVILEGHHIEDWKNNIDKRYDVENGITLCKSCHTLFHSVFGKKGNTFTQLQEFLKNNLDEKIC